MFRRAIWALALFCLTASGEPDFITFPSDVDWVTRESPHFIALYRRGQDDLARRALGFAEHAHRILTPIFPGAPEKTWMVLADFHDTTNGYALNVPYPHMVIFASPPDPTGTLANLDDWLGSVILHEYVHILHLHPVRGLWKAVRAVFGSWVMPNALMPSHFHEGLATFLETQFTEGGRGRSAPFRMIRRQAVAAGTWSRDFVPLDLLDGSGIRWPFGVSPYFFGYQMYESLWKAAGPRGIYRLTESYASNWPYYLHTPLEEVYGIDYSMLWDQVYRAGSAEARKELEEVRRESPPKLRYHTSDQGGKWDVVSAPSGDRVAFRTAGYDRKPQIVLYNPSERRVEKSFDVARGAAAGLCWGGTGGREGLFFLESSGSDNYQINRLVYLDLRTENRYPIAVKGQALEHGHGLGCKGDLSSLFLYQETGGRGWLREFRVELPGEARAGRVDFVRAWRLPEGTWVSGIAVDGEGAAWFFLRERMKSHLHVWRPKAAPVKVVELPGHAFSPRFTGGGRFHAIWDRDGRNEVWDIDPATGKAEKTIPLSGGAVGFARAGARWMLASYEHGGYDLAEVVPGETSEARSVPLERGRRAVSATRSPTSTPISEMREYSPWSTLLPRFWIPFVLVVPDGIQFSAWVPGFDIGQKHFYGLYAGYDTRGPGSAFVSLSHSYRFGRTMSLSSGAYFQPSYIISAKQLLTQWGASLSVAGRIFRLPPFVSLGASFKKLEAAAGNAANWSVGPTLGLSYSFGGDVVPLAALPRWGTAVSTSVAYYPRKLGSTHDYVVATASATQYLPVPWNRRHGFFLRARAGYTDGTAFSNAFFEGGGELLFSFGRGPFLNRGFAPGAMLGRRIVNLNAEYHVILGRPERGLGLLPLFFRNWQVAAVADLTTFDAGVGPPPARVRNPNDIFKIYYGSFGGEIKGNFKVGYYIPMSLRFGLYHGIGSRDGKLGRPRGEPLNFVAALEGSFL